MNKTAGAILAGGQSLRMGQDKATLLWGGKTFLRHMSDILSAAGIEQIYVSKPDSIADSIVGCGPLGGVHSVLQHAIGQYQHLIFVPVDMPYLSIDAIRMLKNAPKAQDLVHFSGHILPFRISVCARWHALAERLLQSKNDLSLRHFQAQIAHRLTLDLGALQPQIFENFNTPAQLQKAKEIAKYPIK